FFRIKSLSPHINGKRGHRVEMSVTKTGVRSYDGLTEGGNVRVEVHIVVRGDTLWKIARQYGVPFEELKRANAHLANPDYIVPGMKIFVPRKSTGEKHHGSKGEQHDHVKHPGKGKEPMKPVPTPKPAP